MITQADSTLATTLIAEANVMLEARKELEHEANIYRNALRHGIMTPLRTSRWVKVRREIANLKEEIEFKLAFAEHILQAAVA